MCDYVFVPIYLSYAFSLTLLTWLFCHIPFFVFYYYIIFYYYSFDTRLIMSNRKGVDSDGREDDEELGGVGEGDTVIRIYCMKKTYFH